MRLITELLTELKAISLWDELFAESREHDEIDVAAWMARVERRAEVLRRLQAESKLIEECSEQS